MSSLSQPWPIPSFVINLERNAERRGHMQAALDRLGVSAEFFSAVDGKKLRPDELAAYDRAKALRFYGSDMTASEIGCYLSHYRLMQRVVAENIDVALIMEDDLIFEDSFPSVVRDLLAQPVRDWLIVRLNVTKTRVAFPKNKGDEGVKVATLADGELFRVNRHPLSAGAYLITRRGAEIMVEYGKTIFVPIDHMMDRFWENGVLPYIVRPCPVRQNYEFNSDIGWPRGTKLYSEGSPLTYVVKKLQRAIDSVAKRLYLARLNRRPACR